ncbi:hypothetical protein ACFX13_043622 [Malus domestica]
MVDGDLKSSKSPASNKFVHLNIFHPIIVRILEEIYKCTHDFPKIPIRKASDSRNSYGHLQGHTYPTKPKALEASPMTEAAILLLPATQSLRLKNRKSLKHPHPE